MSKSKKRHKEKLTGISRKEYEQAQTSMVNKNGNSYIALSSAGRAALIKAGVALTFPKVKPVQVSPGKNSKDYINPPRFAYNRL